jgi:hypothetical protein
MIIRRIVIEMYTYYIFVLSFLIGFEDSIYNIKFVMCFVNEAEKKEKRPIQKKKKIQSKKNEKVLGR